MTKIFYIYGFLCIIVLNSMEQNYPSLLNSQYKPSYIEQRSNSIILLGLMGKLNSNTIPCSNTENLPYVVKKKDNQILTKSVNPFFLLYNEREKELFTQLFAEAPEEKPQKTLKRKIDQISQIAIPAHATQEEYNLLHHVIYRPREIVYEIDDSFSEEKEEDSTSDYIPSGHSDDYDESDTDKEFSDSDDICEKELRIKKTAKKNSTKNRPIKKYKLSTNNSYYCKKCDNSIHGNFVNAHKAWHKGTQKYSCDECAISSNDPMFNTTHFKTESHFLHTKKQPSVVFQCTKCTHEPFPSGRALRQHEKRHHPKPGTLLTCDEFINNIKCIFTATRQDDIDNHKTSRHGAGFICAFCLLETGSRGARIQHAKEHKDERVCPHCRLYEGKTYAHLRDHMKVHRKSPFKHIV